MDHTLLQCQLLSSLSSSSPLSSSVKFTSSSSTNSKLKSKPNSSSPLILSLPKRKSTSLICCAAPPDSQMDQHRDERPKFKDFPYASAPIRDLMLNSLSTLERRLESQLVPCTLPQDVQYYRDQTGTNHGSIFVLSGAPNSPIDVVIGSWLHCKVPTGGSLNITTLLCYMKDTTDTPQFLLELIQASPTTLVVIIDLPSRKDLVMNPNYLNTFYEETGLEKQRQVFYDLIPEAKPYVSPSLYIRSALSPTAILARVDTSEGEAEGGERKLEEIVRKEVGRVVEKVLETWLDVSDRNGGVLEEDDRVYLRKRDAMFKRQSIEIDLGGTLPRLFGQDVADRVIDALKAFMS